MQSGYYEKLWNTGGGQENRYYGRLVKKFDNNNSDEFGMMPHKFTWIIIIKIFSLTHHHSLFWATAYISQLFHTAI